MQCNVIKIHVDSIKLSAPLSRILNGEEYTFKNIQFNIFLQAAWNISANYLKYFCKQLEIFLYVTWNISTSNLITKIS